MIPLLLAPVSVAGLLKLDFRTTSTPYAAPWRRDVGLPLRNDLAYQRYTVEFTVGTPPQPLTLTIDTGSSDFWLPLPNSSGCSSEPCPFSAYTPADSSTAIDTNLPYYAAFGNTPNGPSTVGEYFNDTLTIAGAVLSNMTIASGDVPETLFNAGIWGLIGLGAPLQQSVVQNPSSPHYGEPNGTFPMLFDQLYLQGYTSKRSFSIWMNDQAATTGSILFGGVDKSKFYGELKTLPVVTSGPGVFTGWAVNLTSVEFIGGNGTVANLTAEGWSIRTVLDSADPNMYLPAALYDEIAGRMNVTLVQEMPYVSCGLRDAKDALEFGFGNDENEGGPKITVGWRDLIYPFGLPANMGDVKDQDGEKLCYLCVDKTEGPIFLLGADFIRSVYLVYDIDELTVSMAPARYA